MEDYIKYECKLCGAKYAYTTNICCMCGWKNDVTQNENKNFDSGLNPISYNRYKRVYSLNQDDIFSIENDNDKGQYIKSLYLKNPSIYDSISEDLLNSMLSDEHKKSESYPRLCKVCKTGHINHEFDICSVCGWEDNVIQNDDPNYSGGANHMNLNQYIKFWQENKEDILKNIKTDKLYAIKKAREYCTNH